MKATERRGRSAFRIRETTGRERGKGAATHNPAVRRSLCVASRLNEKCGGARQQLHRKRGSSASGAYRLSCTHLAPPRCDRRRRAKAPEPTPRPSASGKQHARSNKRIMPKWHGSHLVHRFSVAAASRSASSVPFPQLGNFGWRETAGSSLPNLCTRRDPCHFGAISLPNQD